MTCERVRDALVDEILGSGDIALAARAREHAERCPSCRAELHAIDELIGRVRQLPIPPPDQVAMAAIRATVLSAARNTPGVDIPRTSGTTHDTERTRRTSPMSHRLSRFLTGAVAAAAGALIMLAALRSSPAPSRVADVGRGTATDERPAFMLLILDPAPSGAPPAAEEVRRDIAEHRAWADRLRSEGRLVLAEKLSDDPGRLLGTARASDTRSYARTGDRVGGFYIIRASDYDDAMRVARAGPALKYGERIEIRQIEGN